ncbi:MAG: ATP-binding cassette domain-containing protein [Verrucomicrobiota bacterium]
MSSRVSSEPMVELDQVRLAFGKKEVLRGVTLRTPKHERLVILGRSGSGKSTLLRLILGIFKPAAGSVKFEGKEISTMNRRQLNEMRGRIGMVYQYSALISSLNVRDNLALPLEELTSKSSSEIDRIVDQKLEMVGMADARAKMPNELSGGMRKRVGLARALVLEPSLILYDEPTAGLDPVISAVIDELIISLSEQSGATSIIVTHEMSSAFKVATRMAMLYEGQILLEGEPEHFRQSQDPVVAQFIHGNLHGPILR